MFISIDCDDMVLLHKHKDMDVVCDLVFIEKPEASVLITPYDFGENFLRDFTLLELKMLYFNIVKAEAPANYTAKRLRQVLASVAEQLPCTDAVKFEAERQAVYLCTTRTDNSVYKYVKGSTLPAKQELLFKPCPITLQSGVDPDSLAPVKLAPVPIVKATPNPTNTPQVKAAPAVTTQAPRAAPKGGVCARVWAIADSCWEAVGKPTDKNSLVTLRKTVVSNAEGEGINKSTGSVQFGHWQKARILTLS